MKNEIETRPFLEYSDESGEARERGTLYQPDQSAKKAIRNSRLARDLLIFLLASLLWLGAIFFLVPWPSTTAAIVPEQAAKDGDVPSGHQSSWNAQDYRLHNVTSHAHFVTCGNSPADARRNGCRYDTLLNHWVPVECMDQEWIDEYQDDDSWTAFAEYVLTILVNEQRRRKKGLVSR